MKKPKSKIQRIKLVSSEGIEDEDIVHKQQPWLLMKKFFKGHQFL